MTTEDLDTIFDVVGWGLAGAFGWMLLGRAAKAVGDWLIRWRLAGHDHCPQCRIESRVER